MKKLLAIFLCAIMLFSLAACSSGNKKDIVGIWKLVDTETETQYGLGIEFTDDGILRYGFTEDVFEGLSSGEDVDELLQGLDLIMKIKYKIKSDTEMEITMSALFGLKKEKTSVTYSLSSDTLVFDGATYTRAK